MPCSSVAAVGIGALMTAGADVGSGCGAPPGSVEDAAKQLAFRTLEQKGCFISVPEVHAM